MNTVYPNKNIPVTDPYYDAYPAFIKVYEQLDLACEHITSNSVSTNIP